MTVQTAHERGMWKSSLLTSYQVEKPLAPLDVIRVLNGAAIHFVLVGAYGLAGWRQEARATEDVDVVVAARQVKRAVAILLAAFPHLEALENPVVVRLREKTGKNVAIDVMKPVQPPYRQVFKHTHTVNLEGQAYRVPTLEMAMVMKFSAMTSLYRAEKDKYVDAHDFILLVENNPQFDSTKLSQLGSLIYEDGGKDVMEMARKVLAGEKLNL